MKKFIAKTILITVIGFPGLTRLLAQEIPRLKPIPVTPNYEEAAGEFVTITKVEKPWIASWKIVVRKFIESIPQYAQVPSLLYKSFSLTETHSRFGGIYLWRTEAAARNWFTPQWFERVQKTYKAAGEVLYYAVSGMITLQSITETKGNYWSVLSLGKATLTYPSDGLLRIIYITDNKGVQGHISLWASEKKARDYFASDLSANEFFDTPVLLNNQ